MEPNGRWTHLARRLSRFRRARNPAAFFDPGALSPEETGPLLDDLLRRPDGAADVKALADLHGRDRELRRDIDALAVGPDEARRLRRLAGREIRAARQDRAGSFRRRLPRSAVAAAAGLLLVVAAAVFVLRPASAVDAARDGRAAAVAVATPRGRIARAELAFRWIPVRGARSYELEVFDAGLRPVQTRVLESETWVPPPDVLRDWPEGAVYFWKVTARLENGEGLESAFEKFRISGK